MKQHTRSSLSFIIVLALLLSMVAVLPAEKSYAAKNPWPGDGTATTPYAISTADHLTSLAALVNAGNSFSGQYFTLQNSIDLSTASAASWTPIGTGAALAFSGNFDGGGYEISNLTISTAAVYNQGLFGYVSGASIRNLQLTGVSIKTNTLYAGGLAGQADYSTISAITVSGILQVHNYAGGLVGKLYQGTIDSSNASCSITGSAYVGGLVGHNNAGSILSSSAIGNVSGSGESVGGLAGYFYNGSITSSYASGNVTGVGNFVGGLVGANPGGIISASYARGNVSGSKNYVGGLVGQGSLSLIVRNSYATGNVTGSAKVGGLIGEIQSILIESSHASGSVSGASIVGGFAGNEYSSSTLSGCYWNSETSTTTSIGSNADGSLSNATRLTSVQMLDRSSFAGWDFSTIWVIGKDSYDSLYANVNYPVLRWQVHPVIPEEEEIPAAPKPTGTLYYSLMFHTDGGTPLFPVRIASGQSASKPATPVKAGYTFGGWYEDAGFTKVYDFDSELHHNTWIHAKWIPGADKTKLTLTLNIGKPVSYVRDFEGRQTENKLDVVPIVKNDRTLMPIRFIVEPFGGTAVWEEAKQMVTVTRGNDVIQLWIGKNMAQVNGKDVMIDPINANVMPVIVQPGRTMLPVRFIAEALGYTVEYNYQLQQVVVKN